MPVEWELATGMKVLKLFDDRVQLVDQLSRSSRAVSEGVHLYKTRRRRRRRPPYLSTHSMTSST